MIQLNPKLVKYVECRDFTDGLNTLDDPIDIGDGATPYCLNVDVSKRGKIITRYGYELTSEISGASGAMRGLHAYYRTYDDETTIDQSADPGAAYANTYTVPTSIAETSANKLTFTPTKTVVVKIGVYVVAKGTGNWALILHDASNNQLGRYSISNAALTVGWNYFIVPYTWSSGALHFHLTSSVADGTVKTNTSSDLSTASFIETYSAMGDYLLLYHNNGTAYYVTNDNFTPTSIGTYGSDNGEPVRSVTFKNYAIFNNGSAGNAIQKWNGVTLSQLGGLPPPISNFTVFQKRLWGNRNTWAPSTAYYSDVDNPESGLATNTININGGDGTDLIAMIPNTDALQMYKENSVHAVNFSFDSSYNLTIPQLQPIVNAASGALSTGSVQGVYGFSYYQGAEGVQAYGPSVMRVTADQPLPLSLKIESITKEINLSARENITSVLFDQKYFLAVPTTGSTINNIVLVYSEAVKQRFGKDCWTVYTGLPVQQFQKFRNTNRIDQLYFTSNSEPKLFKFNTSFSDDGFGYNRLWRSKTFQFGERTRWWYLDLEGGKVLNGTIYVDLNIDGFEYNGIEITDENLIIPNGGGSPLGYSYAGSSYVGGGAYSQSIPMFKWKKRIWFPDTANYGYNCWFQIRNNAEGHGWAFNRYVLCYQPESETPSYSRTT